MACPPNANEFWLTYHLASRAHLPPTSQLIELEFQNRKLVDLEDVLDHVFRQGFVEPKHRPATWWEKKDGAKLKSSQLIDELLKQGIGRTQECALKLVVEDAPTVFWFQYIHAENPTAPAVTQRIKLNCLPVKLERIAHLTNHIFAQGYLSSHVRPIVHWERSSGKTVDETTYLAEVLSWGEGVSEDKPLRLVIGDVKLTIPIPNAPPTPSPTPITPCPVYAPAPMPNHQQGHHAHHEPPVVGHPHHPHWEHGHYAHCHN
ncbi:hypothetical protein AX16_004608 [Volvariella volvacea WC 439]|nr:hypothetical protein AX16_004608 [Volvariella volvacea WC 439]